jgi:hypothetical protein
LYTLHVHTVFVLHFACSLKHALCNVSVSCAQFHTKEQ